MVLQAVNERCPIHQLGAVRVREGRIELRLRHVVLVGLDVLAVVPAQAVPGGAVQQEGHALQHDGQAHVQVPVGHVVVQQAGAALPTLPAPEQTGGVDPRTEDQRGRDEA